MQLGIAVFEYFDVLVFADLLILFIGCFGDLVIVFFIVLKIGTLEVQ